MKAISPLIATIILIALTIAIAGILGLWAANYVTTKTQEINKTGETVNCALIDFDVKSCRIDSSNRKVRLILFNNRPVDINGFSISFFDLGNNGTIENITTTQINEILKRSEYKIVDIDLPLPNFDKLEIRSLECPDKFKEVICV
ncbi:MAG: archaellin/type IV pilin N-terminal domain-containing protein [Candidatus Aenigmatarchaeota archaeon]